MYLNIWATIIALAIFRGSATPVCCGAQPVVLRDAGQHAVTAFLPKALQCVGSAAGGTASAPSRSRLVLPHSFCAASNNNHPLCVLVFSPGRHRCNFPVVSTRMHCPAATCKLCSSACHFVPVLHLGSWTIALCDHVGADATRRFCDPVCGAPSPRHLHCQLFELMGLLLLAFVVLTCHLFSLNCILALILTSDTSCAQLNSVRKLTQFPAYLPP